MPLRAETGTAGRGGVRQRVHSMRREELEDLFLRAHDDNLALKKQSRALEDENKKWALPAGPSLPLPAPAAKLFP